MGSSFVATPDRMAGGSNFLSTARGEAKDGTPSGCVSGEL
jgi:hypothetical protein